LYMKKGSKTEAASDFEWILKNAPFQEEKEEAIELLRKLGIKNLSAKVQ